MFYLSVSLPLLQRLSEALLLNRSRHCRSGNA
jgi:hypothetical protein